MIAKNVKIQEFEHFGQEASYFGSFESWRDEHEYIEILEIQFIKKNGKNNLLVLYEDR